MPDSDLPLIGTAMKVSTFLINMKKRDLLLLGFIGMFVMFIGVLTGYVPSPLLVAMAQHEELLKKSVEQEEANKQMVELFRLELYLSRESCMHTAKTDSENKRCDRQSVRDAIIGDALASASNSTSIIDTNILDH